MNKTALIIGCTSGIGLALAREFAAHGHPLILVAPDANELAKLSTELISAHGITLHAIPADLEAAGAEDEISQRIGAYGLVVEILVNHAGHGFRGKSWELEIEQDLSMVRLNIEAMLRLTKMFLPPMISHGRGRILNTAAGPVADAGSLMNVYLATRSFVRSYSEGLAEELKDTGVTVTALCAGPTDDDMGTGGDGGEAEAASRADPALPRKAAEAGYRGLMAGERVVKVDEVKQEELTKPTEQAGGETERKAGLSRDR
jgi:short-subunit dehydrogenase